MDITGLMFGNLDEEGQLEEDSVLDRETIAQLSRMGVGGMLSELVEGEGGEGSEDDEKEEDVEGEAKSPTAQDFADIMELAAEEETNVCQDSSSSERFFQKGVSFAASQQVMASSLPLPGEEDDDYDDDMDTEPTSQTTHDSSSSLPDSGFGSVESHSNSQTFEPTPTAHSLYPISSASSISVTPAAVTTITTTPSLSQPAPPPQEMLSAIEGSAIEGSAIPALIPQNMTLEELHGKVKALFPSFKPNGILRFSSFFGPGKPSSLPRIWQGARKPKRRRRRREGEPPREWRLDVDCEVTPDMCMSDDEDKFLAPVERSVSTAAAAGTSQAGRKEVDPRVREWRHGPAKVWYDMLGVPEDGSRGPDYGFKLKESDDEGVPPSLDEKWVEPPDDAFLMVTQQHWENKILWEVPYSPSQSTSGAGGVWSTTSDSSPFLTRQLSHPAPAEGGVVTSSAPHQSVFSVQNYDLIYKRWEDDIIWDSEAVDRIPSPTVARLDPNDPEIILGIPEEPPPSSSATPGDKEGKKEKKSRYLTSRGKAEQNSQSAGSSNSGFMAKKDPFNISNDEYYNPKHVSSTQGLSGFDSNVVQHSTPALDLHPPWYPTHLSASGMRNFHRPKLRVRCPRGEAGTGYYTITTLNQHCTDKKKERERERVMSGGGEVFFMRTPEDLSSCDSHVILAEYTEQHPPILSAIGMATKIKNYYRRPERQVKSHAPELRYGETTYVQNTSYFPGQLKPGQTLQSFENNLFRTPVYHHALPSTDFLLIIAGDRVHVRPVESIFAVGQLCPKIEVPAPNSKPATQFQRELLQVFLFRLFRESDDSPRRIKMEAVRKAFPQALMSESVIRKVLKLFADFKREGYETGWWVLRSDVRLPSEEEVRSMITPEQVCAYHSMLAAELRLRDAGYRGKSLFIVEEEEEDSTHKVDDEILAAPWNTTHHFINAMKGKYQLSVSGAADPTGCGEGFSYTRHNPRREGSSNVIAGRKVKSVMGTDGDLRKLTLAHARSVLRNFGVSEEEIARMSRWPVIDMVRALSTEAARSGDGVDIKSLKYARGARFSHMEAQERYREECQRVFDLQNRVLSSAEVLSTDEESSSSGESDDELGRNLETLLRGKKTTAQLSHEQEEAERAELRKLLAEDRPGTSRDDVSGTATPSVDGDDTSSVRSFSYMGGRRLVISRTFCDDEGREYKRHEVVKNQAVIDAYVRLTSSKDIRSMFADQDQQTREDMKKEKRRIQDQLRRFKKLDEKAKKRALKPKKPKPLTTINMKCSACGERGHMKTNKNCPMYRSNPINVAPTDKELAEHESSLVQDDLVKVEGTKVVLNKAVVEHALSVRRKSLLLRFPKDKMRKRRRHGDEELDYLEKRAKSVHRRKTNPEVPFAALLEKIILTLVAMPESDAFRKPVQSKVVPDYYNVIKFPMDLQTVRENIRCHMYLSREGFLEHVNLIVNNCITYNGFNSDLSRNAQKMLESCKEEMAKNDKELEQLETKINPALDTNAQVALSYILGKVVEAMRNVPDSWPFHQPVSAKKIPDYHKIIKKPMDLETVSKNCRHHYYKSVTAFMSDINQIVENSITYNGPASRFTHTAEQIKQTGVIALEQETELLSKLESQLVVEGEHSGSATPLGSPFSVPEDGSTGSAAEGVGGGFPVVQGRHPSAAMVLAAETGGGGGVGWADEEDVLMQDLQHSSSSDNSDDSDLDED